MEIPLFKSEKCQGTQKINLTDSQIYLLCALTLLKVKSWLKKIHSDVFKSFIDKWLFCLPHRSPLNILGLDGIRVPILVVEWFTIFKRNHEVWMPRTLQNNVWLLKCFVGREAFDSVCKGPALWNFSISDKPYSFSLKRGNFMGWKAYCPFPNS